MSAIKRFLKYLLIYIQNCQKLRKEYRKHFKPLGLIVFFPIWLLKNVDRSTPAKNKIPWVTFEAITFLERICRRNMRVFEYGCGGSTLFFASKTTEVISVEHDEGYYNLIKQVVLGEGIQNVKLKLVLPEDDSEYFEKRSADINSYKSSNPDYSGKKFRKYVSTIEEYADDYFDIVFIDGRARPSCVMHAIKKIKKGGYIVLDNSERERYSAACSLLSCEAWKRKVFMGPTPYTLEFVQTSIWERA